MKPIISCEFNMDTACVELRFLDGTMLSKNIICQVLVHYIGDCRMNIDTVTLI